MRAVQTSKSPAELSFSALLWRILQSSMNMQQDCSGMHAMHMWDLNIHFTRKTDIFDFKCVSSTWQQFHSKQTPGHASYACTKDRNALCHAQTFPCMWSAFRAESPSGGWPLYFLKGWSLSIYHQINHQHPCHFPHYHLAYCGIFLCALLYPPVFQQLLTRPCGCLPFSWIRSLCFHSSFLIIES